MIRYSAALLLLLVSCTTVHGVVLEWQTFCSPGCNQTKVGNGACDFSCMTHNCDYDLFDCKSYMHGGTNFLASVQYFVQNCDHDMNNRINYTEWQNCKTTPPAGLTVPGFPASFDTQFEFNKYDTMRTNQGLDGYEFGLYFSWLMRSDKPPQIPPGNVDWDLWYQDAAKFLVMMADVNGDGLVSMNEASSFFMMDAQHFGMMMAYPGYANAASISRTLGVFGAALYGDGLTYGASPEDIVDLGFMLFDSNNDNIISREELSPLALSPAAFNTMDTNRGGNVTHAEMLATLKVTTHDPCNGYLEVRGSQVTLNSQVPLLARKCTWLINPQWHYDVAIENPNSTLLATAKAMFGFPTVPPMSRRGYEEVEDFQTYNDDTNVLAQTEERLAGEFMSAEASARRLRAIIPTVQSSQDSSFSVRAVPAGGGEFPYHAFIVDAGTRKCSATLIDELFVVTSASCIIQAGGRMAVMNMQVQIGGLFVNDNGAETKSIAAVHMHPAYATDSVNDVALIRLASASTRKPAELYDASEVGFDNCHAMTITALTETTLTKKSVTAVPQQQCHDMYYYTYGSTKTIGPDVLCVAGEVNNCNRVNDNGAGLIAVTPSGRHMLLGISSSGSVCDTLPVIYTRTSAVLQWILAAGVGTSVHSATKLSVKVDSLKLPPGASLTIFSHATTTTNMAVNMSSTCQAGVSVDDFGTGAITIEYTPPPGDMGLTAITNCDATCMGEFKIKLIVEPKTCEANFAMGDGSPASCMDPMLGGVNGSLAGGIRGCQYAPPVGTTSPAKCMSPPCQLTVGWPQLGPMQKNGKAFAGGLGQQMVKTAYDEFGVWSCVRDWNKAEQLMCGAKPMELMCFWYNEMTKLWLFKGNNDHARLVEETKYFMGLDTEETKMGSSVLLARPRRESLRSMYA